MFRSIPEISLPTLDSRALRRSRRLVLIAAIMLLTIAAVPASTASQLASFAGLRVPAHHTANASQVAAQNQPNFPDIVFPVVGPVTYTDTWGACRESNCSRSHKGVDIFTKKLTPLVAAEDGVISFARTSGLSIGGNTVIVTADSGWRYVYVHLNNDRPGTDDGSNPQGWIIPNRLTVGDRVEAGQVIGYLGDSGNAEETPAHLHFEVLHPNDGAVNPTPLVDAAKEAGRETSLAGLISTPEGRAEHRDLVVTTYESLLGRAPSDMELFAWTDRFAISFATQDDLIADLAMDQSLRDPAGQVVRLFAVVLNRMPTLNEITQWSRVIDNAMSATEMADTLVNSSVFSSQYGSLSEDEFITLMFQNLRGQSPTDESRSTWLQRLETESRAVMAAELATSYEAKDSLWHELEVIQAYRASLDRMPTDDELDAATAALDGGAVLPDVVAQIRSN